MNFSHVWKGLAVVAVLFLFSMEAVAQLPVRTQNLQLINPAGGTLTQNVTTGVAGTSYTVTWPGSPDHNNAPNANGDQAILIGTYDLAGTTWDLRWEETDGFVDGIGADNHVTFWNPDNSTLDAQENFEFDPVTGLLGIGVNNTVSVGATGIEAGTAGSVQVGNGAAATTTIDGTAASITVGQVSNGTVSVTTAANLTTVNLAGATGTATLGNATSVAGSVVMYDGDAAGQTATLTSGAQLANVAVTFDVPALAAPAGPRILPLAINSATTADDILFSNGDGTAEWRSNPNQYTQSGIEPMTGNEPIPDGNAYTQYIAFNTDYALLVPPVAAADISVVLVTNGAAVDANILQVTGITQQGFTVLSSAPLAVASINWIAVGTP